MPYPPAAFAAAKATGLTPAEASRLVGDYLEARGIPRWGTGSPEAIALRHAVYQALLTHEGAGRLLYWWLVGRKAT